MFCVKASVCKCFSVYRCLCVCKLDPYGRLNAKPAAFPTVMCTLLMDGMPHLEDRPRGGATTQEGGTTVEEARRHAGRLTQDLFLLY